MQKQWLAAYEDNGIFNVVTGSRDDVSYRDVQNGKRRSRLARECIGQEMGDILNTNPKIQAHVDSWVKHCGMAGGEWYEDPKWANCRQVDEIKEMFGERNKNSSGQKKDPAMPHGCENIWEQSAIENRARKNNSAKYGGTPSHVSLDVLATTELGVRGWAYRAGTASQSSPVAQQCGRDASESTQLEKKDKTRKDKKCDKEKKDNKYESGADAEKAQAGKKVNKEAKMISNRRKTKMLSKESLSCRRH